MALAAGGMKTKRSKDGKLTIQVPRRGGGRDIVMEVHPPGIIKIREHTCRTVIGEMTIEDIFWMAARTKAKL